MKSNKNIASVPLIRHEIEMRQAKRVKIILAICLALALLFGFCTNIAWLMHHNKHEAPHHFGSSIPEYS